MRRIFELINICTKNEMIPKSTFWVIMWSVDGWTDGRKDSVITYYQPMYRWDTYHWIIQLFNHANLILVRTCMPHNRMENSKMKKYLINNIITRTFALAPKLTFCNMKIIAIGGWIENIHTRKCNCNMLIE